MYTIKKVIYSIYLLRDMITIRYFLSIDKKRNTFVLEEFNRINNSNG